MTRLTPCLLAALLIGCQRSEPSPIKKPISKDEIDVVEEKETPPEKEDPRLANLFEDDRKTLRNLRRYRVQFTTNETNHVVEVKLEGKQVTDRALDEVVKLPELQSISLASSSVTDAGIAKLKKLTALEKLGITNTAVTDAGMKQLQEMPSLKYVWVVTGDKLTVHGVTDLQQALPGVRVFVMNEPQ